MDKLEEVQKVEINLYSSDGNQPTDYSTDFKNLNVNVGDVIAYEENEYKVVKKRLRIQNSQNAIIVYAKKMGPVSGPDE